MAILYTTDDLSAAVGGVILRTSDGKKYRVTETNLDGTQALITVGAYSVEAGIECFPTVDPDPEPVPPAYYLVPCSGETADPFYTLDDLTGNVGKSIREDGVCYHVFAVAQAGQESRALGSYTAHDSCAACAAVPCNGSALADSYRVCWTYRCIQYVPGGSVCPDDCAEESHSVVVTRISDNEWQYTDNSTVFVTLAISNAGPCCYWGLQCNLSVNGGSGWLAGAGSARATGATPVGSYPDGECSGMQWGIDNTCTPVLNAAGAFLFYGTDYLVLPADEACP